MDPRWDVLEAAYRDHAAGLWAYLRRRSAFATDAEELFQETFVAAARDIDALKAAASKTAWLIGIARNLLRRERRRRTQRRETELRDVESPVAADAEDERLDSMRRAICRLPTPQREVVELRLQDDLSYAEIAEALQIPIGTVRSRLHHAVAALRERMASIRKAESTAG